ncbi:hypothetical protein PGN35_012640 [Nodosilinea sp. PGN35]|uniref:hypothetical protein n=1 Tax=Nodosilinea sp. PGN35 TaxID=3020489 RepID=UPI0023B33E8D|nr:hypothetical protein [Nodosilinea sp. TSF1-S3]MDF0368593.1 hypothetical protein [Nodosilinea sp. TSF1-S3]
MAGGKDSPQESSVIPGDHSFDELTAGNSAAPDSSSQALYGGSDGYSREPRARVAGL